MSFGIIDCLLLNFFFEFGLDYIHVNSFNLVWAVIFRCQKVTIDASDIKLQVKVEDVLGSK